MLAEASRLVAVRTGAAAAACSNGLTGKVKSLRNPPPPPTSRSEASLRRLRLDEEAYKWIVSSCKYLQERAPKSGGDYELTMFHQDERKMK